MAKTLIGIVVSDKADKTIVVSVATRKTHPLYRKQYTVSKKFAAHDEKNAAANGDKVAIVETRPLSATKRFRLEKILESPLLRADALAAATSEDSGKKPSKPKTKDEASEKPVASKKPEAKS
jgi:small subunit ribosomal protein S17